MEEQKRITEWKDIMVKELTKRINKDTSFYFSNYLGLKAEEFNELRRLLEPFSSEYLVLKNSIAKIALENAGLGQLTKFLEGGTGVILGGKDAIATAKVASKFSKSHESLKLKGGYLEGKVIDIDKVNYIASLPSKGELITKIVYGIKSPISGLVCVLGNTLRSLLYVVQAIKDKEDENGRRAKREKNTRSSSDQGNP